MQTFKIKGFFDGCFDKITEKEVEGCSFKVEGFEFMELFVYQHDGTFALGSLDSLDSDYSPEEAKGKYIASEGKTGFYFGDICDDPEEAVYKATLKLREKGAEFCKKRMGEVISGFPLRYSKTGVSATGGLEGIDE